MQICLEPSLNDQLRQYASDCSMGLTPWLYRELLKIQREPGFYKHLCESTGQPVILAQPSNVARYNIKIDDPHMIESLDKLSNLLNRTKPQIVYTLIRSIAQSHHISVVYPSLHGKTA